MSIEKGGTTNKPSSTGNFFKRAIATAAVLATLSGEAKEPTPVNNFNTNNIEVVEQANTLNYEVEEITQTNNYYNYIKNIMPSVNKYFPEYSNYFRNVLSKFNDYGTAEKYLINKRINRTLSSYSGSISTEKDKITTALIVFDYLEGDSKFIKDPSIIKKNQDGTENRKIKAANAILKGIKREYDGILKDLKKIEKELENISNLIDSGINENDTKNIIDYSEKYMEKYKEYFIDAGIIKESSELQNRIKGYIKLINTIGEQPSEIGNIYIKEYKKIKK